VGAEVSEALGINAHDRLLALLIEIRQKMLTRRNTFEGRMKILLAMILCLGPLGCATYGGYVAPKPMPEVDQAQISASGADATPPCNADFGTPTFALETVWRFYPEPAMNAGLQGFAYVRMDIQRNGASSNHVVLYSEPGDIFDSAAIAIVQLWRFPTRAEPCVGVVRRILFRLQE
jgi:TonB family protein